MVDDSRKFHCIAIALFEHFTGGQLIIFGPASVQKTKMVGLD
jgi:hypothetical protein